MPFKSKKQQRYLYTAKPKGVNLDEWADKTDFKNLPEKARKRKKKSHIALNYAEDYCRQVKLAAADIEAEEIAYIAQSLANLIEKTTEKPLLVPIDSEWWDATEDAIDSLEQTAIKWNSLSKQIRKAPRQTHRQDDVELSSLPSLLLNVLREGPSGLVLITEWKAAVNKTMPVSNKQFAEAAKILESSGKINLHYIDDPQRYSAKEKEEKLIEIGGVWYNSVTIRKSTTPA